MRSAAAEMHYKDFVRWRHEMEQKIEDLKNRPPNLGRDRLIEAMHGLLASGKMSLFHVRRRGKPLPANFTYEERYKRGRDMAAKFMKILILIVLLASSVPISKADNNVLSDDEKKAGWRLLFDGKTTEGWRGYKMKEMPPGWKVVDGALVRVSGGAGGKGAGGGDDIITVEQFANFELQLDWKIVDKAGNSGIVLRASEDATTSWHTGPEVQLLDNAAYPGRSVKQMAGACYDLYAPIKDVSRAVGEWNQIRIVANGPRIEHWLNGTKVVEYELGSEEWKKLVAQSKFKDMKHFKTPPSKGHICLQDHTARLEFRNIKIRPLP
jgi:hypothetical protein